MSNMGNCNRFTVAGGLLEDGVLQLQVLHDAAGPEKVNLVNVLSIPDVSRYWLRLPQVKVLLDNLVQLCAALSSSAVVEDCDRERLGNTDSIGNLQKEQVKKGNQKYGRMRGECGMGENQIPGRGPSCRDQP